ncbi:MAG: hypothetical protein QG671_1947 [Actinomycetota bacterium]|nr:hypothetical protein [Actinomycetota bacterium]
MNAEQRRQWRRHVYGCTELTTGQRLVLLALSDFSDWPAGTNARPGVDLLAEICGLKPRAVKGALDAARKLKLIERTGRANPKRHLAAVYRLLRPTISRCTTVHVEPDFKVHGETVQGARPDHSRCTTVHPTYPYQSLPRESAADADDSPSLPAAIPDEETTRSEPVDSEPPRYCRNHPYGTSEKCSGCGIARHNHEAWQRRQLDSRTAHPLSGLPNDAQTDTALDCPLCDEQGWRLGADGLPDDNCMHCDHQPQPKGIAVP